MGVIGLFTDFAALSSRNDWKAMVNRLDRFLEENEDPGFIPALSKSFLNFLEFEVVSKNWEPANIKLLGVSSHE